ncbi:MAG: response regulator [Pedobacter sp.]|uniref:response regulator n=1 Tax=Pedobacter sp. TaxID=1411316 RepID=UPI003396191D
MKMNTTRFISLIISLFTAGAILLIYNQYVSSGNIIISSLILLISCIELWLIIARFRQQHKLIEQLDASEKRSIKAALIKENFMANMSHEIRTPLNAILGFTNLLGIRKLDPEPQEFVQAIQKAGESLLAIINDILDLSKIEAGMMRIENTPFSVRGLFHSVKTLFFERIKEKRLEIKLEIDEDVPDTLIGDDTRLTQILVNLIGNAVKFTEKGFVLLRVYVINYEGEQIELGCSVCDTGIGIAKDKIGGIFDRFHQAEDSTTRNYGGTGLGLSIVKDLLQLLKGSIEVESSAGKGTAFHFSIPYRISSTQVADMVPPADDELELYASGAVNILVVDDNQMNQNLMRYLLKGWNLSFDIAGNGLQALKLLNDRKYDVVLMDIQMPGMDGYATTQRIRNQLQLDVPIIAMTAHALAGEREKCLSFGMNDYLPKPINQQQLYANIAKFARLNKETERIAAAEAAPEIVYTYIDLSYMKEISRGNVQYEKQVTAQFLELIPKALEEIELALLTKDFAAVNYIAHDLKTSISIMGMTDEMEFILDQLEYADEEQAILGHNALLKNYCSMALKEAAHYYELLNHKNSQL